MMQFGPDRRPVAESGRQGLPRQHLRLAAREPLPDRGRASSRAPTSRRFATVLLSEPRGLGALEYLLFYEGVGHRVRQPAAARGWTALSADEIATRASAPTRPPPPRDVLARATALDAAWDPAADELRRRRCARPAPATPSTRRTQVAIETRRPRDLLPRPDGQGQEARHSARPDRRTAARSRRCRRLLRVPVRGPLEGEPRAPTWTALRRIVEGATPTTPVWASTTCSTTSAPTALADTLRAAGGRGARRAGRDRGAGPRSGAGRPTGRRCSALRDAIGAITTYHQDRVRTRLLELRGIGHPDGHGLLTARRATPRWNAAPGRAGRAARHRVAGRVPRRLRR